ncbi:hypothetical protein [Tissierella pigra]|uniref:Uncharacterized protein n=1 Tax=Tissierella pigra TaxID=2607614 RepID=A0A6N7XIP2_9FIRM|nr:hypothetical protein [Tissierella pigra]MSU01941.1 hypothetical protein [Tissierella pigra]
MSNFGIPTDEQLAKINKLAKRTLSKDEVFVFSGKSAGDMMIPNRNTKLSLELLQVMVADAKHGVSFMLNHNWNNWGGIQGIPYGKVFDGRIIPSDNENETMELHLDKFIFRDDEIIDGVSANALIKRIETGILSDTSIGFSTDIMKCSICGENYYGGKCRHWKGSTYEMGDGTQKVCTLTAMPPSIIIPYNNNALFEESIVWDGAYPGAVVTQSKHGDIIETPSGKFSIIDTKEELPENTPLLGQYCNGNIVTMVKKSDHNKIFGLGGIEDEKPKGSEELMNENLNKMLESFEIEVTDSDGNYDFQGILIQLAEKWDGMVETIKASVEPLKPAEGILSTTEYLGIPLYEIKEELGEGVSGNDLMKLAKEGQEYHKSLSDEAIAMGVRAMGNDFPTETWKKSFEVMGTNNIKDIMKTWELQANAGIPAGRQTDPGAGQKQSMSIPDDAFKVGK